MNSEDGSAFGFDVPGMGHLPRVPGVFVTSPGRGEGKTLVAGAVARHLRRAGRNVDVFHPVAIRCRHGRGGLISPDADFLAACAESRRTLSEIAPVRTAAPTPPIAAEAAPDGRDDLAPIFDAWRRLTEQAEVVVVDGAGGLMCPITDEFWTVHLARMLRLPVVIVVCPHAAVLDHTLLTIHALRSAGLEPAGVVVNRYRGDTADRPELDLWMWPQADRIAQLGRVSILALVPEDEGNSVSKATVAESAQFAIDQAPWEKIIFGRGGCARDASSAGGPRPGES